MGRDCMFTAAKLTNFMKGIGYCRKGLLQKPGFIRDILTSNKINMKTNLLRTILTNMNLLHPNNWIIPQIVFELIVHSSYLS